MNTTTNTTYTTEKKPILLSKRGMKELKKSITQLEHDKQTIQRGLREFDKLSSHDARFERNERLLRLEAIDMELHEKQQILNNAKLIPSRHARMRVAIGSVVDLIDQQGRLIRYTIVDSIEANPSDGRISIASPLGSSLIGKTVHDMVEWGQGIHHSSVRLVNIS